MSRFLSRRQLLAAAGGAGLLVPLLRGNRVWAAPTTPPRRLVIMQATNGVMSEWWPGGSGSSFTLSDQQSPLAPHKQDLIVLGGLKYQCQLDTNNGGVGHQSLPFILTGVKGAQAMNQAGPDAIANGISLDQVVAKTVLKGATPIPSLELGAVTVDRDNNSRSISFNGPALATGPDENPPEIDPMNVYKRLLGFAQTGDAGSGPSAAAAQLAARRKSVLDAVGKDLTSLSKGLGTEDQGVLAAHLAAVQALEAELGATGNGGGASCTAPSPPTGYQVDAGDQLDKLLRLQLGLVTTAFACDLTRVVTVMMDGSANDGITFPWLGSEFPDDAGGYLMNDHHGYAHAAGDGGSADGAPYKRKIDQWYMTLLADFIQGLKNIPEGNGTVFDNTVILWLNNMGNGAAHNVDNIPMIVAGGKWYFKTGQYYKANDAPHNGLLTALANAMGANVQSFGDPAYGGELTQIKA